MKKFFLRPINNIFLGLVIVSVASLSYLTYYIKFSDEKISDQEYLKRVDEQILRFISSDITKKLTKETFRGKSSELENEVINVQSRIKSIPSSTFKFKEEALDAGDNFLESYRSSLPLSSVISTFKNLLISFHKLVNKNNWRNIQKIVSNVSTRIKSLENSERVIESKRIILKIKKDLNLMTRLTDVSTLSFKRKEIIKKRVGELETSLVELEKDNENRLLLTKGFESYVKKVVLIHNKIKEVSGSNILAVNERQYLFKNTFMFQILSTILLIICYFIALRKEGNKESVQFEKNFWVYFKKHILNMKAGTGDFQVTNDFEEKAEEYREFIESNISFNKLFKTTIPQRVFVFDHDKNVIFQNLSTNDVKEISSITTYSDFVSYFNIGDMIRNAEKYSFSFERDSSWYTVYYEVKKFNESSLSAAYVMKVDSKVVGELEEAKERVVKIEGTLDEVLNKNNNVSLDRFVHEKDDIFFRIEEKSKRVKSLFDKVENSFIQQIQQYEHNELDFIKFMRDFEYDLKRVEGITDIDITVIKESLLELVRSNSVVDSSYQQRIENYKNQHKKNIEDVERAIKTLLELRTDDPAQIKNIKNVLGLLSRIEVNLIDNENLESAQQLQYLNEDKLTDQLSSLCESIEDFRQPIYEMRKLLSLQGVNPKILSNEQSMINDGKELN